MPKDAAQAKIMYGRAAAVDTKGHVELGRMAEQGIAGPVAYAEASEHYSQAAAKEDAEGLVGLGRLEERVSVRRVSDARLATTSPRRTPLERPGRGSWTASSQPARS